MSRTALLMGLCLCGLFAAVPGRAELHALVVQGLGGSETWAERFEIQAAGLFNRLTASGARATLLSGSAVSRQSLADYFDGLADELGTGDRFAAILVGHGSFDGDTYKFNIPGPDVTGAELLDWVGALPARSRLLVNTSSASGALQEQVNGTDLLLVTATRNGRERQATRFAGYFLAALDDAAADLDKNQVVSVAEAFAYAQRGVADHYETENRLATEHPVLAGKGAERFELARLGAAPAAAPADPRYAELVARRDALDRELDELKARRESMQSTDYLNRLQELLVALALVSEQIDALR